MTKIKIPPEVKYDCESRFHIVEPDVIVRTLTDIDGNVGETYLLADSAALAAYSRKLGEPFHPVLVRYDTLKAFEIATDRPFAYLVLKTGDQSWRLKCAAHDHAELTRMQSYWTAATLSPHVRAAAHDVADATDHGDVAEPPALTPTSGFFALLHAIIWIDGDAGQAELSKLNHLITDGAAAAAGIRYGAEIEHDTLINELNDLLSPAQKRCLIANMLEIAMVDGQLAAVEKAFIEKTRLAFGLPADEVNDLFDALIIKNNLTVFTSSS